MELQKCEGDLEDLRNALEDVRGTYLMFCQNHDENDEGHEEYTDEINETLRKLEDKVLKYYIKTFKSIVKIM